MQKLHPRSVWIFFFSYLIRSIFIFGLFLLFLIPLFSPQLSQRFGGNTVISDMVLIPVLVVILYLALIYTWSRLSYHYYDYELTDDALKREYGVIFKRYTSIPYERIQNVDIYRGITERIFGLSSLQVQTAGFSSSMNSSGRIMNAEGVLPGLEKSLAEAIREELIKRAKNSKQGI